jgi:hypothetical protein
MSARNGIVRAVLPVWILLLLTGCTQSAELQPVLVGQDCTSADDAAGSACFTPCTGLGSFGHACKSNEGVVNANLLETFLQPIPPLVGWSDGYDNGTNPCPCWEWVSTVSRGFVRFDLTKIVGPVKSIAGASLLWKPVRTAGSSPKSCVMKLYETTGDWQHGKTPVTLLHDNLDTLAVNAGYFGVASTVQKWWSDPNKNWGFMFEPSRATTKAKSNAECLDSLESIRLVVKYKN